MHFERIEQRYQQAARSESEKSDLLKQRGLLCAFFSFLQYKCIYAVNIRIMTEKIIEADEEDIIFLNTAKKFNTSAGQCLIGLSFNQPEHKAIFEERALKNNYKLVELKANDPLLKILL